MNTKLFFVCIFLAAPCLQGMREAVEVNAPKVDSRTLEEQKKVRAKVRALLQEFADRYNAEVAPIYPHDINREPNGVWDHQAVHAHRSRVIDYSIALRDLANEYMQKIKDIDANAVTNLTKLNAQWRHNATPEERRKELLSFLEKYRELGQKSHEDLATRIWRDEESKNRDSQRLLRNNVWNLADETGLMIEDDLSQMTDAQLNQIADSFLI